MVVVIVVGLLVPASSTRKGRWRSISTWSRSRSETWCMIFHSPGPLLRRRCDGEESEDGVLGSVQGLPGSFLCTASPSRWPWVWMFHWEKHRCLKTQMSTEGGPGPEIAAAGRWLENDLGSEAHFQSSQSKLINHAPATLGV